MLGFKKIIVADNERVLFFKKNSLTKILAPGEHTYRDFLGNVSMNIFDITQAEIHHKLGRFLFKEYKDVLNDLVIGVDTNSTQIGLIYLDGKLSDVIHPNSFRMYWNISIKVEVKLLDISNEFEIKNKTLTSILASKESILASSRKLSVFYVEIPDNHVGLLRVNGRFEQKLNPGIYGYWQFNRKIEAQLMDCRIQNMEVNGQEILTKDKVSVRINLSASYRIVDSERAASLLKNHVEFLYREFQLALREVVGTRSLDAILEDKDIVDNIVESRIKSKALKYGLEVLDAGVKDIILPGDMKAILNKVVEAQKSAEANLIKRREETQATRSLHNTAKVMEGNSTLMRLKELEVLERVASKIDSMTVYGGLEGVMKDMVKISDNNTNGTHVLPI